MVVIGGMSTKGGVPCLSLGSESPTSTSLHDWVRISDTPLSVMPFLLSQIELSGGSSRLRYPSFRPFLFDRFITAQRLACTESFFLGRNPGSYETSITCPRTCYGRGGPSEVSWCRRFREILKMVSYSEGNASVITSWTFHKKERHCFSVIRKGIQRIRLF